MLKWNGGGNAPNLEMKKYLITRATVSNGQRVNPGDVVEVTVDEGIILVNCNKAQEYVEPKPKPKKVDRSVGLKTSDTPAPKKRTKSK
jgi:hypothetical protein